MILQLKDFIYKKLNVELITRNVTGIYFQVPSNNKFPYIYIGDFYHKNISTKDQNIGNIYFKIIIYSRDKSLKFMIDLSKNIKLQLKLDAGILINLVEENFNLQNDGLTHQIIMTFNSIIGDINDI